jgi:restriction system protein
LQKGPFLSVDDLLLKHPNGMSAKDVLAQVEHSVTLTEYENGAYPNRPGDRRFEHIVRFNTIGPVKAGWLVKTKGKWILTEDGKDALSKYPNPEELIKAAGRLYLKWKAAQPDSVEDAEENGTGTASTALEEAEEAAWAEIEKYLKNINPYDLQSLVAALLKAMAYHVSWVSPPGPDKGIDILAHTDPLGTQNPRIKVQVKRHAESVAVDGLRAFLALLNDQDVGIFVATGGFTTAAAGEARTQEKRKITLLDLEKLFELWVQHYDKISEADKRLLPLRPVYYIAPPA